MKGKNIYVSDIKRSENEEEEEEERAQKTKWFFSLSRLWIFLSSFSSPLETRKISFACAYVLLTWLRTTNNRFYIKPTTPTNNDNNIIKITKKKKMSSNTNTCLLRIYIYFYSPKSSTGDFLYPLLSVNLEILTISVRDVVEYLMPNDWQFWIGWHEWIKNISVGNSGHLKWHNVGLFSSIHHTPVTIFWKSLICLRKRMREVFLETYSFSFAFWRRFRIFLWHLKLIVTRCSGHFHSTLSARVLWYGQWTWTCIGDQNCFLVRVAFCNRVSEFAH